MPADRDFISSETHELNYLLKKWGKKQHIKNRQVLRDTLVKFKDDVSYKPHNRESFYKYVEDKNIRDLLEDLDKKKKKKKGERKPLMPDLDKEDLTIDDPFVKKAKKSKKQTIGKKQKISIHDLSVQRNSQVTEMKLETKGKGEIGNKTAKKSLITALIIFLMIIFIIILIIVGTCLYQDFRKQDQGTRGQQEIPEKTEIPIIQGNDESGDENNTGSESRTFTTASLSSFLETCTPLYFQGDLEELLPGEEEKIIALAAYLDNYRMVELLVEGHTADMGVPGEEMELSIKRAKIIDTLIMKYRKTVEVILSIKGYGAKKQVVTGFSEEMMQQNRRVEISVIKTQSE
jgi:outer membrane protein OmpA-like peptidoglycan-associated protein